MAHKNLFFFLLFLSMVAWGGSWVNVKVLSSYINAYEMIFLRFLITAITMVPIIVFLKKSFRIDVKSFGLVVITSVALIAYMNYFFLGTKYGTASLGGAMVTTLIPIITFVFLVLMRLKSITRKDMMALILGALGVSTMLNIWKFDWEHVMVVHNLYFFLAAILWPIVTILSSKSTAISPIVFTFYMYLVTVVLVALFFVDFRSMNLSTTDGVFWFNIACITLGATTFANTVYFLGIERLGAGEVSSFIFLVPFSAIGLSAIFLEESISLSMIIGTLMSLYAVKLLNNITFFKQR